MQGLGSSLSKHVLGMKFMRKTLTQLETQDSGNSALPSASNQSEATNNGSIRRSAAPTIVEEVPSYSAILGWNFGRASYGGFNPTVEYHVRKGHWKAEHVPGVLGDDSNPAPDSDDSDTVEPRRKRMKMDDDESDDSGGEEGPVVGSIIGTAGGKSRKSKKEKKPKVEAEDGEESCEEIPIEFINQRQTGGWSSNKKVLRKNHKKQFRDFDPQNNPNPSKTRRNQRRNQKRKIQKRTAAAATASTSKSNSGSGQASKKFKFMKPEED